MNILNAVFVIFCASNIVAFSAIAQRKRPFLQETRSLSSTLQPTTETVATKAVSQRVQNRVAKLSLPSNATSIRSDISDNFSCNDKSYGYYADVENDCQIFHVCLPVTYPNGRAQQFRWSFICPEDTTFNQELFTCVRNDEMQFDCAESERYYELNRNIGLVKDEVEEVDGNDLDGASSLNRNDDRPESVTVKIAEIRKKLLTSPATTSSTTQTPVTTTTAATTPTFRPKFSSTKRTYRTSTTPKKISRRTTTTTVTSPPTTAITFKTTTNTEPSETLTTSTNYLDPFEEGATTEDNLFFTTDNPSNLNANAPKTNLKSNDSYQENKTPGFINNNSFEITDNPFMTTSQIPLAEYETTVNEAATRIVPELLELADPMEKLDAHNGRILDSEEAKAADEVVANIKQLQNILSTNKANTPIGMRTMRGQWNSRKRRFLFKGDTIRNRRKLLK